MIALREKELREGQAKSRQVQRSVCVKLAPVKPPGVPLLHYILQLVQRG